MNEWEWHLLEDKPPVLYVTVDGVELRPGARVRLCPRAHGDAFDFVLTGRLAVIESIEQDYEGNLQFAVVLDDDPGKDLGILRQPGHRFFFAASEIKPAGPDRRTEAEG